MRISEAYEHEPILPYQAEDNCPVACQGSPSITCVTDASGSCCTVTMTQQICVSVPIRYGVNLTAGEPTISCADNSCIGCGCC